jgi:hypothetical protein
MKISLRVTYFPQNGGEGGLDYQMTWGGGVVQVVCNLIYQVAHNLYP